MARKRTNKKPKVSGEHLLQKAFFEWLTLQYPQIRKVTFAIPNGGSRSLTTAVKLKAEGVTAGVSDVFISYPTAKHSGFYIEFKFNKNKPTDEQAAFIERVRELGYKAEVIYNLDDAIKELNLYIQELCC